MIKLYIKTNNLSTKQMSAIIKYANSRNFFLPCSSTYLSFSRVYYLLIYPLNCPFICWSTYLFIGNNNRPADKTNCRDYIAGSRVPRMTHPLIIYHRRCGGKVAAGNRRSVQFSACKRHVLFLRLSTSSAVDLSNCHLDLFRLACRSRKRISDECDRNDAPSPVPYTYKIYNIKFSPILSITLSLCKTQTLRMQDKRKVFCNPKLPYR